GTGGFDIIAAFERFKDRIGHIHISNYDGREHLELRTGNLNLAAFLQHAGAAGYKEGFCLEIMPEYFPSGDEEYTVGLLKDNLDFIRQNLFFSKKKII
ncbi:MAG: hypothetical protein U9N73_07840, partial [Candidatus Auribacterota bacterium]|nr:hypothetical protein [Candidatus Auribacterota bacterium]